MLKEKNREGGEKRDVREGHRIYTKSRQDKNK